MRSSDSSSSTLRSQFRVTRNAARCSAVKPGKSSPRKRPMTSSSSRYALLPSAAGTGTSRLRTVGTWTTARSPPPFPLRRLRPSRWSTTARLSDLLRRWGKGCPGSTASGVSAGKTAERKCSWAASRWARSRASGASSSTPWERRRGTSSSRQRASKSRTISWTSAVMAWNCSVGERPSASVAVTPEASCCLMPATRTMKNSSRFAEAMERKRSRSYVGSALSWTSARIRRLKASALSSRLMNIRGSVDSTGDLDHPHGASGGFRARDDDVKRGPSQARGLARRSGLLHHVGAT